MIKIDVGAKILVLVFYGSSNIDFNINYKNLLEKITKSINFQKTRKISIKGRVIALNTMALSKLWHTAHVLPLSKIDLSKPYPKEVNYLSKFEKISFEYIWQGKDHIPRKEITCSFSEGGLNAINIGYKALALRAGQLKLILDRQNLSAAARFARHWIAADSLIGQVHPHLKFLERYKNNDISIINNHGLHNLRTLTLNNCTAQFYAVEGKYPVSKDLYKTLVRYYTQPNKTEIQYWKKASIEILLETQETIRFTPNFQHMWKDLSPPFMQETTWKIRKFIRIFSERNFFNRKDKNLPTINTENCPFCQFWPNRPIQIKRESHFHIFSLCPFASEVWALLDNVIKKIEPRPIDKILCFLGSEETNANGIILNTLISITNYEIWISRCKLKKSEPKIFTPPTVLAKKIVNIFKVRLAIYYSIYKKRRKRELFKRKFHVQNLFSVEEEILNFHF